METYEKNNQYDANNFRGALVETSIKIWPSLGSNRPESSRNLGDNEFGSAPINFCEREQNQTEPSK